tara:strand:- start:312 stop:518 length:207 start_codon:yes stop_codon:yes gene_type:complete
MIHHKNLIKYLIMFFIVTTATKIIPSCGVLQKHAIYVGLIASSTFALIDICSPNYILIDQSSQEYDFL